MTALAVSPGERRNQAAVDRRRRRRQKVPFGAPIAAFLGVPAYLLFWPIAAQPVDWHPQPSAGYQGVHLPNEQLNAFKPVPLSLRSGPEPVAVTKAAGRLYLDSLVIPALGIRL